MSWKANTAALTVFITGTMFVVAITMPSELKQGGGSRATQHQQYLEDAKEVHSATLNNITDYMKKEYGENITNLEAEQLNCVSSNRYSRLRISQSCYHNQVLSNISDTKLPLLPIMNPALTVKKFGTLTIGDRRYTLESLSTAETFYITQN